MRHELPLRYRYNNGSTRNLLFLFYMPPCAWQPPSSLTTALIVDRALSAQPLPSSLLAAAVNEGLQPPTITVLSSRHKQESPSSLLAAAVAVDEGSQRLSRVPSYPRELAAAGRHRPFKPPRARADASSTAVCRPLCAPSAMSADIVRAPSTTFGSTLKHIVDEHDGRLTAIKRQHAQEGLRQVRRQWPAASRRGLCARAPACTAPARSMTSPAFEVASSLSRWHVASRPRDSERKRAMYMLIRPSFRQILTASVPNFCSMYLALLQMVFQCS
ncbi:hypothetical protein BJ912DRAFT_925967 [Pholiota molesta]|nr:hypothetical protein BJ912DRAFT_925967 [Pholiota molesta]